MLQARLSPESAVALEQIAEDFLAKTLELGAAIARRRNSDYLQPADLNIALERIWCAAILPSDSSAACPRCWHWC